MKWIDYGLLLVALALGVFTAFLFISDYPASAGPLPLAPPPAVRAP